MKMVRKQFYITGEQDAKLKHLAESMDVTEAELVRQALEMFVPETGGWRYVDKKAWQDEVAFMKRLAASRPEGGTTEHFDREEGYEERLSKLLR